MARQATPNGHEWSEHSHGSRQPVLDCNGQPCGSSEVIEISHRNYRYYDHDALSRDQRFVSAGYLLARHLWFAGRGGSSQTRYLVCNAGGVPTSEKAHVRIHDAVDELFATSSEAQKSIALAQLETELPAPGIPQLRRQIHTAEQAIATLNANFDKYTNDGAMWQRRSTYWHTLLETAQDLLEGLEWEVKNQR